MDIAFQIRNWAGKCERDVTTTQKDQMDGVFSGFGWISIL